MSRATTPLLGRSIPAPVLSVFTDQKSDICLLAVDTIKYRRERKNRSVELTGHSPSSQACGQRDFVRTVFFVPVLIRKLRQSDRGALHLPWRPFWLLLALANMCIGVVLATHPDRATDFNTVRD